jgi:hypothetical protein
VLLPVLGAVGLGWGKQILSVKSLASCFCSLVVDFFNSIGRDGGPAVSGLTNSVEFVRRPWRILGCGSRGGCGCCLRSTS